MKNGLSINRQSVVQFRYLTLRIIFKLSQNRVLFGNDVPAERPIDQSKKCNPLPSSENETILRLPNRGPHWRPVDPSTGSSAVEKHFRRVSTITFWHLLDPHMLTQHTTTIKRPFFHPKGFNFARFMLEFKESTKTLSQKVYKIILNWLHRYQFTFGYSKGHFTLILTRRSIQFYPKVKTHILIFVSTSEWTRIHQAKGIEIREYRSGVNGGLSLQQTTFPPLNPNQRMQ